MNADLVRLARFDGDGAVGRGAVNEFERLHMSRRACPAQAAAAAVRHRRDSGAAASPQAIAAVVHEVGLDGAVKQATMHHTQIAPLDIVGSPAQLQLAQRSLVLANKSRPEVSLSMRCTTWSGISDAERPSRRPWRQASRMKSIAVSLPSFS